MTYQEKFNELQQRFEQKSEAYIQAQKALSSILGWGDSDELNTFLNARVEFEEADNAYHELLNQLRSNNISPEETYREA
jgi:hypothetical protein